MSVKTTTHLSVTKVSGAGSKAVDDSLAIEEPLEIRVEYGEAGHRQIKNIAVTMRTPGSDAELATGFLFTEGIIKHHTEVLDTDYTFIACTENKENVIQVSLNDGVVPELKNTERNFYTTSSCGVCGKGSIAAIRTVSAFLQENDSRIEAELLHQLPIALASHQDVFSDTGGLHASALFNLTGDLLLIREDVGRHNALDKLIGAALANNWLPLNKHVLLLSGRASFELIQKAAMAGIGIVAAIGAPSSLAVKTAQEFNITLIGFLRDKRFNIYTVPQRILIKQYETTH